MAVTACTISAERWLDEVILAGSIVDVLGATVSEAFTLPAGLGDVAIINLTVLGITVATTPGAATSPRGVEARILSSDGSSLVDMVGTSEWFGTGGTLAAFDRFSAFIDPDALVLWREGEQLSIRSAEVDVNAAPTGDLSIVVKVVRVRPIEGAVKGPMKLVNVSDM